MVTLIKHNANPGSCGFNNASFCCGLGLVFFACQTLLLSLPESSLPCTPSGPRSHQSFSHLASVNSMAEDVAEGIRYIDHNLNTIKKESYVRPEYGAPTLFVEAHVRLEAYQNSSFAQPLARITVLFHSPGPSRIPGTTVGGLSRGDTPTRIGPVDLVCGRGMYDSNIGSGYGIAVQGIPEKLKLSRPESWNMTVPGPQQPEYGNPSFMTYPSSMPKLIGSSMRHPVNPMKPNINTVRPSRKPGKGAHRGPWSEPGCHSIGRGECDEEGAADPLGAHGIALAGCCPFRTLHMCVYVYTYTYVYVSVYVCMYISIMLACTYYTLAQSGAQIGRRGSGLQSDTRRYHWKVFRLLHRT